MATRRTPHGWQAKGHQSALAVRPEPSTGRRALGLLVLSGLLLPLGCASTPPAPLTEATKAYLGTIGVVAAQIPPDVEYRTPGQGGNGGAAIGAAKGVGLGVLGAAGCMLSYGYVPEACVLALATPYFAVRYAVDQATEGVVPETIAAGETAITAAFAARNPQAVVRDEVFRVAAAQTGRPLVLLPGEGPRAAGETLRYTHLTAHGVDTVIEITLQRLALQAPRSGDGSLWRIRAADLNPYLTLAVTARTRVLRIADDTVLYDHAGERTGRGATFPDWGANDAQLLRDGLEQLLRQMAADIVVQVFGVAGPPATDPAVPTPTPATTNANDVRASRP